MIFIDKIQSFLLKLISMKKGLLTFLILLILCNHKKESEKYFRKAFEFLSIKNADSALFYVNKGLELEQKRAEGYNMRGVIYHLLFENKKDTFYLLREIEDYKKAISIDSTLWEPYINLGTALYIYGKKKDAVPYLKKGLKLNPYYGAKKQVEKMIEEGSK